MLRCPNTAVASIAREATRLRLSALDQVMRAGFGHLGSCMSCADLLAGAFCLFDLSRTHHIGMDYLILSKGHAAPLLYAAIEPSGRDISYAQAGSSFPGHPNAEVSPHVAVSAGSVGLGPAIGVGLAMGLQIRNCRGSVIVVTGDGELQAGTVWEALQTLSMRPELPLLLLVDANEYQGGMAVTRNPVTRRMLKAAILEFREINGNDVAAVAEAMLEFAAKPRAMAVWAHTVRGAGVRLLEQNPLPMTWRPRDEDLDGIRRDLAVTLHAWREEAGDGNPSSTFPTGVDGCSGPGR